MRVIARMLWVLGLLALLAPAAAQIVQRSPAMVRNGSSASSWPRWVLTGTGRTLALSCDRGAAISSRWWAKSTSRGWS